ncbi:hypothetical protein [Pseudomonas syringae]|uniref:hypothetical protein n=1 Tax=Pseudomonas syringae TaxID=317 RepID=UPI0006E71452|nr:hypothetical protein [Pseudomonas syringae]KPY45378.1 Uncharacterized protein ALO48_03181 [Pseudomonas syringae pv. rhaphiolepidis]KWS45732.1 hypothetical protein AL060_12255 [Pseudomonas syringae pv. rhaphiolepidis]
MGEFGSSQSLQRGYFAEYMVYTALLKMPNPKFQIPTSHFSTKMEGDVHDLVFWMNERKFTVQVKSKDSFSKLKYFGTSYTRGYDCVTNTHLKKGHWSDIYVFASLTLDNDKCSALEKQHKAWNPDPSRATDAEKQWYAQAQMDIIRSVAEVDNWDFYLIKRSALSGLKQVSLKKILDRVQSGHAIKTSYEALPIRLARMAMTY